MTVSFEDKLVLIYPQLMLELIPIEIVRCFIDATLKLTRSIGIEKQT